MGVIDGLLRGVPIWAWVVAAAIGWGGWQRIQVKAKAAELASIERKEANARIEASERLRVAERKLAVKAQGVATNAAKQLSVARDDAASARSELDGLRNAIAANSASSATGTPGATDGASRAGAVVAECSQTLVEVAERLDACTVKASGLQEFIKAERSLE